MKHIKKGSPEKPGSLEADCLGLEETDGAYIMPMPPIPPMPPMSEAPEPQLQLFFSGLSAMTHSVVSSRPATERPTSFLCMSRNGTGKTLNQ